jgi:HEAT repeat protein
VPATRDTAEALKTRQEIHRLAAKRRKSDIPKFKEHLQDEFPMIRLAAAKAIYNIAGKEELPTLMTLFQDSDKSVRAAVIQLVGEWRDSRAVTGLTEVLKTDVEESVRLMAIDALGKIQDTSAVPVLIEALKDKSGVLRAKANRALETITFHKLKLGKNAPNDQPEEVYSKWLSWWESEQLKKYFSLMGVKQLEEQNNAEAVKLLVKIANLPKTETGSETVRVAAVASLCRMTCPEAREYFEKILVDTANESLCIAAINAIVACKKKDHLSVLKRLADSVKSEVIRQKATWGIKQLEGNN